MSTSHEAATHTRRLLHVQGIMDNHAAEALSAFVRRNPEWNGAQWADALDVLLDSDSHLDVTEPLYEALEDLVTDEQRRYINMVALTLLYARRHNTPEAEYVTPPQPEDLLPWLGDLAPEES